VESLDLEALGFRHAVLNETGRPPYHPGVLLKLYVYGYLNRLRSPGLRLGQASPDAAAAPRTAASPAGLTKICWRTCSAGSAPAPKR
jgi:hypothetical protein